MSDLLNWMQATLPTAAQRTAKAQRRAAHAWRRLHDKFEPVTSVAFKTAAGVTLAAQEVRIEVDNRASMSSSAAGSAPRMTLIVYGVRNHATIADTIMEEGFRFILGSDEYRCIDVILTLGEIQGIFVAIG